MHLLSHLKSFISFPLRFVAALWVLYFRRKPPICMTGDEEALISSSSSPTFECRSRDQEHDKIDGSSSPLRFAPISFEDESVNGVEASITPPPSVSKKKALLIGIRDCESASASPEEDRGLLKGPHVDVLKMQQLLLECYGYNPNDITVIIDDCDPEHTQPTKENLIQSMKDFVADALPGDQFFLHYSGHGTQLDDDDGDEEDGLDECILTCDNKIIRDDMLNQILVAPLPIGSSFVSVFDSCHSGTMLDLKHYRCNQVYVPWINKGSRKTELLRNIVRRQETQISDNLDTAYIVQVPVIQFSEEPEAEEPSVFPADEQRLAPLKVSKLLPTLTIATGTTVKWVGSPDTPLKYVVSPQPLYCTGRCRDDSESHLEQKADVISISATKDEQLSWEDPDGCSMTQVLVKVLRKNPHSSLKHIMTSVSHELHDFYVGLHDQSRDYKGKLKETNIMRQSRGKTPYERRTVEMDNFQDPQISSHYPLDMDRPWPL